MKYKCHLFIDGKPICTNEFDTMEDAVRHAAYWNAQRGGSCITMASV